MRAGVPSPDELRGGRFWCEVAMIAPGGRERLVPVAGGSFLWEADQWPAFTVSGVKVPAIVDGVDLVTAGLVGSDGHRVRVTCHAVSGSDVWEWEIGTFLVTKFARAGAEVTLDAVDLTQLIIDHQNAKPKAVYRANFVREMTERLLGEDGIPLVVDDGLDSPVVPKHFAFGVDRSESLKELLTAWGVFLSPGVGGSLHAHRVPATRIAHPAVTLSDGAGGTIIDAPLELSRNEIFNHVVVVMADEVRVVEAVQRRGRFAVALYGWRSKRIESDSLTRLADAQIMAERELAKGILRSVTVPVEMVPDWRLEPYTAVSVDSRDVTGWGRVTGFDFPLTHDESAVLHVGMEV